MYVIDIMLATFQRSAENTEIGKNIYIKKIMT